MLAKDLPIYKDTYLFVRQYIEYYEQMKVLHKHTLGKHIYDISLNLFTQIERANREYDDQSARMRYLNEYQILLDDISTLIRLACDVHAMSVKHHSVLSSMIVILGKQVNGMRKAKSQNYGVQCVPRESESIQRPSGGNFFKKTT